MLVNPPTWTQNGTYTAEQDRNLIGAIVRTEGVANMASMAPKIVNNSRQISIAAGGAYIAGDYAGSGGGGMYFSYNNGAYQVAIPVAGSVARYDLIVLRIYDSSVSGSVNEARFDVVSGTPATSPVIPAVPRSAIPIAAVRVNPGTSQVQASDLSDQRTIAQINGAVTGQVDATQSAKLDQVASPSNPILITKSDAPGSLHMSTGSGFKPIGVAEVYNNIAAFPKSAPTGSIAVSPYDGRTYIFRNGAWKFFIGWGPYVSLGRSSNSNHVGPYVGGLALNAGSAGATRFGSEALRSSTDYSTFYALTGGTAGTVQSKGGGITFKRPGMYNIEYKYQVTGLTNGTTVTSRLSGPGISQFTTIDNQENRHIIDKGQNLIVASSGTVAVSNTGKATHGMILPWLTASKAVTLSTIILRAELTYEF